MNKKHTKMYMKKFLENNPDINKLWIKFYIDNKKCVDVKPMDVFQALAYICI